MKKIGIITINDNRNLGNRLQNFAVQKTIEKILPYSKVVTIRNTNRKGRNETIRRMAILALRDLKHYKRTLNFHSFNKMVRFSRNIYDAADNNEQLNGKYDYFIVGSDQVWNPNYGWLNSIDLLSFAAPSKRIAFSASYGISTIPDQYKKKASEELLKFRAISVREDRGLEITKELTSRSDISVLVDPTMLISDEEWGSIANRPKPLKDGKPIILKYFLGGATKEADEAIEEAAKEYGCQVIDIFDEKSKFYSCGPREFLWLEKNAFLICTDSFHSSVFAIINEKPFVIFERKDTHATMNSRLNTLLQKFKLSDRRYDGKSITTKNLTIDYSEAKKILKKEQEKSLHFLRKALGVSDEK